MGLASYVWASVGNWFQISDREQSLGWIWLRRCVRHVCQKIENSFWAPCPIPLSSRSIGAIFATNHPSKRFDPLKVKKMAIEKCAHALSMRFLVSNLKYRGSGQGSNKSMGGQKSYYGCHIFVHTGCLTNVTHRIQLKPKKTKLSTVGLDIPMSMTWMRLILFFLNKKRQKNFHV